MLDFNYTDAPKMVMDLTLSYPLEVNFFVAAYPEKVYRLLPSAENLMVLELFDVTLPSSCPNMLLLIADIKNNNLSPYIVCSETRAISEDKDFKYKFFTAFNYVPNLLTNELDDGLISLIKGCPSSKECLFSVIPHKLSDKSYVRLHRLQFVADYTKEKKGHLRLLSDRSTSALNRPVITKFFKELSKEEQLDVSTILSDLSRSSIVKVSQHSSKFNSGVSGWSYFSQGERSLLFRKGNLLARLNTNNGILSLDKETHYPSDVLTASYFSVKTEAKYLPKVYGCHGSVSVVEFLDLSVHGEDLSYSKAGRKFIKSTMLGFYSEMTRLGTRVNDLHLNNFGQTKDGSMKVFDLDNWNFMSILTSKESAESLLREAKFYRGIVNSEED
jgi:hypothetical protein